MADQNQQVAFTRPAADKIVEATKTVLGLPVDGTGSRVVTRVNDNRFFWAQISDCSSFTEVYATISGSIITWTTLPGGRTGTLNTAISAGHTVLVRQEFDCTDNPPTALYFPVANQIVAVEITGNADGGGFYNGTIVGGPSTADGSDDLNLPEGCSTGDDALILLATEDGNPTHWLDTTSYSEGIIIGQTSPDDDSDPQWIVLISNGKCRTDSPDSLAASEGDGTDPDPFSWQRDSEPAGNQYGDGPISVDLVSRIYWDGTGNTLYSFTRTLTFDACGHLVSISQEASNTVDTTTDCSGS
jgi:hypothetical protein